MISVSTIWDIVWRSYTTNWTDRKRKHILLHSYITISGPNRTQLHTTVNTANSRHFYPWTQSLHMNTISTYQHNLLQAKSFTIPFRPFRLRIITSFVITSHFFTLTIIPNKQNHQPYIYTTSSQLTPYSFRASLNKFSISNLSWLDEFSN